MLKGKTIVLGVTGSIAAYKIANLASALVKLGADTHVIMTHNATNFINPIAFETLTSNKCLIDTFDRDFEFNVEHVALAKRADIFLIAPATANLIAKMAHGIADDMLTTTLLACTCPILIAPAMNTNMYHNPIVQDNLKILKKYGMGIIDPLDGYLAEGTYGDGKMPEPEELLDNIIMAVGYKKDLIGQKILITAGPTQEAIDPVRFISNHSTGKMGVEIARAAAYRGADVTLIIGKSNLKPPRFIKIINIVSAKDMFNAVTDICDDQNIIIKAAAVADFRPQNISLEKIKKLDNEAPVIHLEKTDDILKYIGEHKKAGQFVCGFSMETENMIKNSKAKLESKHLDMIVANNLKVDGAGFETDTNIVTFITRDFIKEIGIMSKFDVANEILDKINSIRQK